MSLLRGATDKPAGLSSGMIDSWLGGATGSAKPLHVRYVLARFAALPTNRDIPLTPGMSAALEADFIRTGTGAGTFLKRRSDLPPGLTWQIILGWIDGTARWVSQAHWEYVTSRLRALPDTASPPNAIRSAKIGRTLIDPRDLGELRDHRARTGIGGAVLLRSATDKPKALTPAMISGWLSGRSETAIPEHVIYVLTRYRSWP
jgi:hypothetical protein